MAVIFSALANSPDPVFVTDRHNRIASWNHSAERLLGFTAEEAVGSLCGEMLGGCDASGNRYCGDVCPINAMAARGEIVRQFNLEFKAKGGQSVVADVGILHFAADGPGNFYLAHIVHARLPRRQPVETDENDPPPRSPMLLARESPDVRARRLTAREVEILGMLAAGHMTPEIASRLNISRLTARNHIQNILDKLEVHSKAEAVAFAFQKHLL